MPHDLIGLHVMHSITDECNTDSMNRSLSQSSVVQGRNGTKEDQNMQSNSKNDESPHRICRCSHLIQLMVLCWSAITIVKAPTAVQDIIEAMNHPVEWSSTSSGT